MTAWQQLIEFWSPRLYSYVVYSTHSEVDAQHLLQQAFATVVQSLVESTHVCDLTVIVVSALYRTVARYQQEFGAPSLDAEYLRALVNPGQPRFIDALKQLAPQVRQLLLLRYCVGLTVTELAPITGCSASALSALFRAATQHFQSTALL
ncbi:MAG: sigma-70 family RNA polymerase sigma factor [Caldilineaceae bacterium]